MKIKKRKNLDSKITTVILVAVVLLVILTLRIAYIQFIKGDEYT